MGKCFQLLIRKVQCFSEIISSSRFRSLHNTRRGTICFFSVHRPHPLHSALGGIIKKYEESWYAKVSKYLGSYNGRTSHVLHAGFPIRHSHHHTSAPIEYYRFKEVHDSSVLFYHISLKNILSSFHFPVYKL